MIKTDTAELPDVTLILFHAFFSFQSLAAYITHSAT